MAQTYLVQKIQSNRISHPLPCTILLFLPTWREKTGKSGHMTVLHFLVCAQGCKISDTVEQTSLPSPSMLDSLSCLPSKMYLLWGKTSTSRESLHCFNDVWRQCWWRWLSLVPYVLRAWHIYLRWTGLKNTSGAYLTHLWPDKETCHNCQVSVNVIISNNVWAQVITLYAVNKAW